ncbi:MAG: biotin transporter BioY [Peptococcaceae bacterium]|nr:biotin transporter BioY [Peptococcaceae bacterium]
MQQEKMRQRGRTRQMVMCGLFVALIALGAFIKIPLPLVPVTLQVFFTMMAGLLLGPRLGALSVIGYLVLGLAGLPIFTMGGGPSYVLQPTFGYLIGFALGAFVTGKIAYGVERPGFKRLLVANLLGLALVYVCGMVYYFLMSMFYLGNPIGLWPLLVSFCFVSAPGDIALSILAAVLAKRMIPVMKREGIAQ